MNATDKMRNLIMSKYKSVRQFSIEAGIPYTTVKSGLEKGIGGMAVETVIKMCRVLGVSVDDLDDDVESLLDEPGIVLAAHRTNGYDEPLPPEAMAELESILGYLREKYKKK